MKDFVGGMDELSPFRSFYDRYRLTPNIVIGKSILTEQFTVTTTRVLIVPQSLARYFALAVIDNANPVFIGGPGVTVNSGFAINPQISPFVFAVVENTEVWAVSAGSVVLFKMDFGI